MKKISVMTMIIVGSLAFLPFHVNAEINDAEQRIINVVSGNYSFNGKTYKITDDYQAKVREYLDREDINMTDKEVSEYITKFYNNLSAAIEGGYMEEVKKTSSTKKKTQKNKDNNNEDNNEADSSEQDVVVIDPNMNYTVNADGTVESEEKAEDTQQATLEELAGEYSVSMDKIQEIQQEIQAAQEEVTVSDPLSEEDLEQIMESEIVSPSPSASAEPTVEPTSEPTSEPTPEPTYEPTEQPSAEATLEPAAEESAEAEAEEETKSSSGAGIIAAIAAVVLIAGGGIFAFIKKKKSE